eukprot:gene42768-52259_t
MDWLQARQIVWDDFALQTSCRELTHRLGTREDIKVYPFVTTLQLAAFDPSLALPLSRIGVDCLPYVQNITVMIHAPMAMSALLDILNIWASASATSWHSIYILGNCEMTPEFSQDLCRVLRKQGAELRDFQIARGTEQIAQCLVDCCPRLTTMPSFVHTLGWEPAALLRTYQQFRQLRQLQGVRCWPDSTLPLRLLEDDEGLEDGHPGLLQGLHKLSLCVRPDLVSRIARLVNRRGPHLCSVSLSELT